MTWYVNTKTGSDSNDGRNASSAFKTLGHAASAAKPGDTVLLAPGAYDQDLPQQVSAARARNLTIGVVGAE
jgi:polysaccharidase protein